MAIRVGQLTVQYVADVPDASDVRVTRLFAQGAIIAQGSTAVSVTHTIFAAADASKAEQSGPDYYRSIAQTIGLVVDSQNDPVYNRWVGHQLFGAAGDTTAEALYRAVSHSMLVAASVPDEYREVLHYLGFTDRRIYDVGHSIFRKADPAVASEAEIASCFNLLFSGSLANVATRAYNVTNDLGFTIAIGQLFDYDIEDDLGLSSVLDTSSMTFERDDDPAASSSGGGLLRQSISISVDDNACRAEQFAPIIGAGPNDEFEEFLIDGPALVSSGSVVLNYPADGTPTDTLTLEVPDFGNEHTNSFTRIDRPTRGGDRKIYADPKWATWERLTMTITGIGCGGTPTVQNIIDFLNTTLGKEIELTDWESRTWRGFIVAPETEIREEQEGLTLQLTFEGEIATLEVQYDQFDVIHGQHTDGTDIEVTYEL